MTELSRVTKVSTVFSTVMVLNETYPDFVFCYTELVPDEFVLKCNPRGQRDMTKINSFILPLDDAFTLLLSQLKKTDNNDPSVMLGVANTLLHFAAEKIGLA